MNIVNEFPGVMAQARVDLAGNVSGKFSPADWESILREAERRLHRLQGEGRDESAAWQEVVREFHQERYWGFIPNYLAPRLPPKKWNLGVSFIIMAMLTMTFSLVAVVWLGQNYTTSGTAKDKWLLFAVMALVIANFVHFLWRNRHHQD